MSISSPKNKIIKTGLKDIGRTNLWLHDKNYIAPVPYQVEAFKAIFEGLRSTGITFWLLVKKVTVKLKTRIFERPQIRQIIRDPQFLTSKNELVLKA